MSFQFKIDRQYLDLFLRADEAYQPSLFYWLGGKGDLYFLRQWESFQPDFHHNNLTKNT